MHPRITELLVYIDAQLDVLRAAYEAVPAERRATRPAPDRWSPAENVHHLAIVERRIGARLAGLIEEARALPPEAESTSIFPCAAESRVVRRTSRFKTSEASEPRNTDAEQVWAEMLAVRADSKRIIAAGDGLALSKVSAPHPALGPLNGYEWIVFLGSHAARHADQIREDANL